MIGTKYATVLPVPVAALTRLHDEVKKTKYQKIDAPFNAITCDQVRESMSISK